MTTTVHKDHHYSITVNTSDLVVVNCLRAVADYAQKTGNKRIAWGGTTKKDWIRDNKCITFHFSELEYRDNFEKEAMRVLFEGSWTKVLTSDNDPAMPKS